VKRVAARSPFSEASASVAVAEMRSTMRFAWATLMTGGCRAVPWSPLPVPSVDVGVGVGVDESEPAAGACCGQ